MPHLLIYLTAFLAGAINAVAGGGTFFTFPTLVSIGGLTEKVANMTSTIGLWPGSASSVVAAKDDIRNLPLRMVIAFSIVSLIGGIVGAVLLRVTSISAFRLAVPWLLLFATLLFGFSKPLAKWAGRGHGHRSRGWTIIVALIQFFVAIYGGYFGAGMGILMLAGLSFAGLDDIHQMNALKVLLAMLVNLVAAVIFLFGPIDWWMAGGMAAASTVGGFLGIRIAKKLPQTTLRAFILMVGLGLTVAYFWKSYH